jgi:hypothetical protein
MMNYLAREEGLAGLALAEVFSLGKVWDPASGNSII